MCRVGVQAIVPVHVQQCEVEVEGDFSAGHES